MAEVNELAQAEWTISLLESDGTAAVPSTVEWRLKCMSSGNVLQDWTSVTPTTTSDEAGNPAETTATITVASTLHAMQTASRNVEQKALCIAANRGLSTEWNDEIVYTVVRLNARS